MLYFIIDYYYTFTRSPHIHKNNKAKQVLELVGPINIKISCFFKIYSNNIVPINPFSGSTGVGVYTCTMV